VHRSKRESRSGPAARAVRRALTGLFAVCAALPGRAGASDFTEMSLEEPMDVEIMSLFANSLSGTSTGVEVEGSWQAADPWRLTAGYSFIHLDVNGSGPTGGAQARAIEGRTADHQGTLRSRWRVRDELRFDTTLRATDELPAADVPAQVQLDARLAWDVTDGTTVELTGRNLLDDETTEFRPTAFPGFGATTVERSVFASIEARF